MAATEDGALLGATLRELRHSDVADGLALSREAGWNQTADDWSMLIRLGRGFAMEADDQLVATGLALPYPTGFGWIGMILVHGPYRRRGLATRLMERTIATLREAGLVAMLDATPAGEQVYARMGFRPVERLTRWRGAAAGPSHAAPAIGGLAPEAAALDRAAFGADRSAILADLLDRPGSACIAAPGGDFVLVRAGRTASNVGPLVARDTGEALVLLDDALARVSGPAVIDVPDRELEVAAALSSRGFEPERPYIRMALGRDTGFGEPRLVRAIAGPELG